MARIYVFTAENGPARARLAASVERPLPDDLVLGAFPEAEHPVLQRSARSGAGFYAWGVRPGSRNERTWRRIQPGDFVLCASGGSYRILARALHCRRSAVLADALWGVDPEGRPAELVIFLSRPEPVDVPLRDLAELLARGYVGLTSISDAKLSKIRVQYGSIEAFVAARLEPGSPLYPREEHVAAMEGAEAEADEAEVKEPIEVETTAPLEVAAEQARAEPEVEARAEEPEVEARAEPGAEAGVDAEAEATAPPAEEALGRRLADGLVGPVPRAAARTLRPRARVRHPRLRRAAAELSLGRSLFANAAGLAAALVLTVALARGLLSPGVWIEPIEVPPGLAEQGHTPRALAWQVARELERLAAAVERQPEASGALGTALLLPPSEASLRGVVRDLRGFLGLANPHLGGFLRRDGDGLVLRLQLEDGSSVDVAAPGGAVERVVALTARTLIQRRDPLGLAAYLAEREPAAAIDAVGDALARDAGQAAAHAVWGRALAHQGDLEEALARYAEAARLDPEWAGPQIQMAGLLAQAGAYERALPHHRRATELDPQDASAWYAWANTLAESGSPEAASERYARATELDPANVAAFNNWGNALHELGDYEAAIQRFARATEIDPTYAAAYNNWALTLRAQGDTEGALEKYRRATELDPAYAVAYYNWGNALRAERRYSQAAEKYRRATELDPGHAVAYNNWGVALRALGDDDRAIELFERATELDPGYAIAYNNWGIALQTHDAYDAAIQKFERASEVAPKEPAVYYNWGRALEAIGDAAGARAKYSRALALDPASFQFVVQRIEALGGSP